MQVTAIDAIRILQAARATNLLSLTSVVSASLLPVARSQRSPSVLARITSFSNFVRDSQNPLFQSIKAADFGGIAKRVFLRYNKALLRKTTLTLRFRKAYRYV